MDHVDQLAVLHQGEGRGRRRLSLKVIPRLGGSFLILSSEHRIQVIRFFLMGKGLCYRRPGQPRRTAADGIDHNQRGPFFSFALQGFHHFLRCAEFLKTDARQFVPHRLYHHLHLLKIEIVRHQPPLLFF